MRGHLGLKMLVRSWKIEPSYNFLVWLKWPNRGCEPHWNLCLGYFSCKTSQTSNMEQWEFVLVPNLKRQCITVGMTCVSVTFQLSWQDSLSKATYQGSKCLVWNSRLQKIKSSRPWCGARQRAGRHWAVTGSLYTHHKEEAERDRAYWECSGLLKPQSSSAHPAPVTHLLILPNSFTNVGQVFKYTGAHEGQFH